MRKITLYISGVFKCDPKVGNYQKTLNYIENDISFKSIKKNHLVEPCCTHFLS